MLRTLITLSLAFVFWAISDHVGRAQPVSEFGNSLLAYRQVQLGELERVDQALQERGGLGRTLDYAKQWVPLYAEIKLRGLVPNSPVFSGLLATNLDQQGRHLLGLPFPAYKTRYDAIIRRLIDENPALAKRFNASVMGMSNSDILADNMLSLFQLIGSPLIAVWLFSRLSITHSLKSFSLSGALARSPVSLGRAVALSASVATLGLLMSKMVEHDNMTLALNLHSFFADIFGVLTIALALVFVIRWIVRMVGKPTHPSSQ